MSGNQRRLKAVVLDWAGTTIDHGSRAPARVFEEIFRRRGITITTEQAREPMGMAKREHIAAIAAMPEVSQAWIEQHDGPCDEQAVDALYAEFLPLQKSVLSEHCDLIEGVVETVACCREWGMKIGSTTGYTRELMEIVTAEARSQGYQADSVLCAEDAPRGRPAPYLLFRSAIELQVYPMWSLVKVDDTAAGIEAGRNAGCWTVGVTRTGNGVGLSAAEVQALDSVQRREKCESAARRLYQAGAHLTIESVADLPKALDTIEQKIVQGELPF